MTGDPVCPRCGRTLLVSGVVGETVTGPCPIHGPVVPLNPFVQPNADHLGFLAVRSAVPLWLPWPLPTGWVFSGAGHAGSADDGVRATVVACSGPGPLGGGAELLIVAEELGVGLGARYSGIGGPDPGESVLEGTPHARVETDGHPTSLWHVPSLPDRAVYAGAAAGLWLWLVFFPELAGTLLVEPVSLADIRVLGKEVDMLPYGALTPRLEHPEPSPPPPPPPDDLSGLGFDLP